MGCLGVVVFPGSNCDRDALCAWESLNLGSTKMLWHTDQDLRGIDMIVIPGGFSYGDALRAGAIARFSPIMQSVAGFAADGGPVLGICNGFQILCEAGLLPGGLVRNQQLRFVCRPVHLRIESTNTPFTNAYDLQSVLRVPVAHGEGRYICDSITYDRLIHEDRIVFRYCDENGGISSAANPNGSLDNIAGIIGGPQRNILGMMPHPERAVLASLGSVDGSLMFYSVQNALRKNRAPVEV